MVYGDTEPVVVQDPEVELRGGVSLVRRLSPPSHRRGRVCLDTSSIQITEREVVLHVHAPLVSGEPVPPGGFGFGFVPRDALAIFIQHAKVVLGVRVPWSANVRRSSSGICA
jgi:hypothetical protein